MTGARTKTEHKTAEKTCFERVQRIKRRLNHSKCDRLWQIICHKATSNAVLKHRLHGSVADQTRRRRAQNAQKYVPQNDLHAGPVMRLTYQTFLNFDRAKIDQFTRSSVIITHDYT